MRAYRQGDVLIFAMPRKAEVPTEYKEKGDNVVIEGEITGHKHAVENGRLYEKDDKIIIEAFNGCVLKHEEHNPIRLPRGLYEIKIQEEYDEHKHSSKVKD